MTFDADDYQYLRVPNLDKICDFSIFVSNPSGNPFQFVIYIIFVKLHFASFMFGNVELMFHKKGPED